MKKLITMINLMLLGLGMLCAKESKEVAVVGK